jgi:uncharacterized protein YecT (DUF1311 family)
MISNISPLAFSAELTAWARSQFASMKSQMIACIALLASPLLAQETVDPIDLEMGAAMEQNGSTAGMVEAIAQAQNKWEEKLNVTYKYLKGKMPAEEFSALQQAQRAWISFRDKQIESYDITYGTMDGSMWIPIHAAAVMGLTRKRAQELENLGGILNERSDALPSSLTLCEEKTKLFLESDYIDNPAVHRSFFTPDFAVLWIKACNPPEGETIYWGADPILETQDEDPAFLGIGPSELQDDGSIQVPVGFQHKGSSPYKKTFVFEQREGGWLIADIITTGLRDGPESEFKKLQVGLGE